jgi:hypothetical protein
MGNFIFEMRRKIFVKSSAKSFVIPMDFGSKLVKFHNIFDDVLRVLHEKILDCSFGISLGVIRSKVELQFIHEQSIIVHEMVGSKCWRFQNCRFKPL